MAHDSSDRKKGKGRRVTESHKQGRKMSAALVTALSHPLRRKVLRVMNGGAGPHSPGKLAKAFGVSVSDLSYHVRVLSDLKVVRLRSTQMVRGAVQHLYVSNVVDNALVSLILAETKSDDDRWDSSV